MLSVFAVCRLRLNRSNKSTRGVRDDKIIINVFPEIETSWGGHGLVPSETLRIFSDINEIESVQYGYSVVATRTSPDPSQREQGARAPPIHRGRTAVALKVFNSSAETKLDDIDYR